jgi:predicted GNAT family N-acyltransferase
MTIEVRMASFASESAALYAIRDEVFVREQRVPVDIEHDEDDLGATHVLAFVNGTPAATGRILADGKIGRMAVLKPFRGQRVGESLLATLLGIARTRALVEVYCHAQHSAIGFYQRAGFVEEGPVFYEAGIAHQLMRLLL